MIKVTAQQRKNALKARDVMWPSVPAENVTTRLRFWREDEPTSRLKPTCGTHACFGGWCAWWPAFRKQGIRANVAGAPIHRDNHLHSASEILFGHPNMFSRREYGPGNEHSFTGTDHELVTHRLNWLIENSEVVE